MRSGSKPDLHHFMPSLKRTKFVGLVNAQDFRARKSLPVACISSERPAYRMDGTLSSGQRRSIQSTPPDLTFGPSARSGQSTRPLGHSVNQSYTTEELRCWS